MLEVNPKQKSMSELAQKDTFDLENTLTPSEVATYREDYKNYKETLQEQEARYHEATKEFIHSLEEEGTPESANILDLIQHIPPHSLLETGSQSFLLSTPLDIAGRMYALAYVVDENNNVAARLFYKSKSEGEWRVSPEVIDEDGDMYLSKGEKFDAGYVRETRLSDDIREHLTQQEAGAEVLPEQNAAWLYSHFDAKAQGNRDIYLDVADQTRLRALPDAVFRFAPGAGFDTEPNEPPAHELLKTIHLDESITPVFDTPIRIIETNHPMLGTVTTEVYKNIFDNLEWHMSHDASGRVWISGITGSNEDVNSYGASQEVLIAGLLDNKPLEYATQVNGLQPGRDFAELNNSKRYVDITPLLDNLPIIQMYRRARSIDKK